VIKVHARINGIKYRPLLCSKLYQYNDLNEGLNKSGAFILNFNNDAKIAVSRWVSPKRTRSYPYARIYDTLGSQLKKVTIIPVLKDEGLDGDRDFIQWDTISLMSLLNIYVILGYYTTAKKNNRYDNKITNQKFDIDYIAKKLDECLNFRSDALHWNLCQVEKISFLTDLALKSYRNISKLTGVKMHSENIFLGKKDEILDEINKFKDFSRQKAVQAQKREVYTRQPKEKTEGSKGIITIENFLGGVYYFTCDEINPCGNNIYLIEAKHSKGGLIPSINDIKDGLLKMVLYVNLEKVEIDGNELKAKPVLKLTSGINKSLDSIGGKEKRILEQLLEEAKLNKFKIIYNQECLG